MNFRDQLRRKILKTITSQWPDAGAAAVPVAVDYTPDEKFGDYSTSVAMKLAPVLRRSPVEIAEQLKTAAGKISGIGEIRVVPPGFINFFIDSRWLQRQAAVILKAKQRYGRVDVGQGARVLVEFVSVNPTGPLHVGHGRGAFTGDVLVNVLKLAGYRAYREYYVNDYGNQVNILAESVLRKYWQHHGIRIEFPDYCYQGAYVDELAQTLYLPNYKFSNVQKLEEVRDKIKGRILQKVLGGIRRLLERRLGIRYDRWFSERSLYSTGVVDRMLRLLKEQRLLYRSEGALWMKTTQFGDEKDRVVIKANGEPVYFLSDIAYHWDKLVRRKFVRAIDILGADHHGYVGRLQAAMAAVGAPRRLDIIIAQMVRLMSGGQELKMSKRSGTFVTLEELVDEVGADAVRFFFLMYDANTHM
ncbi:MAG: arginine--tRNA ligase, partial [Patescibacteria group bacterium]